MLDHIGFAVSHLARSRAFYAAALAPLGFGPAMDVTREQTGGYEGTGYGPPGRPRFWIGTGERHGNGIHVAFVAPDRAAVDAFHRAALAAGGTDNGAPGLRPHYHPDYYGAFVLDMDGNNIEAVCHLPG
ncbi:MAG TPA: VOC family protein [Xanthomonadaceae bacterium]|jgi:catechol 2,3-dioxygenase-like lactoylglutathione lyase family enzyme